MTEDLLYEIAASGYKETLIVGGKLFKCECGCPGMKKVDTPEGEPDGKYFKCQRCGSIWELI
ncbi:MAG: hypothetical protein JL50_10780 [Peptococcaceae bacterium BICA1-7]|nr:MAG: hypothetical protein JL50_10780 [Peptococcaceae bacterium BICA1-7]HBV95768.1 hypothetical protein [Desulfotomaculum sp.]